MVCVEHSVTHFPNACSCIVVIRPFRSQLQLRAFLHCSLFDDSLDVGAIHLTSARTQPPLRLLRGQAIQKADLISAKELWDQVGETERDCSFVQSPHWG